MNTLSQLLGSFTLSCCFALGACGGANDDAGNLGGPPPAAGTLIGAGGGTISSPGTGPSVASVVIPPGALAVNVQLQVEATTAGAPALPTGLSAQGLMFAFTPHGTTFAAPVTITMPFDPALVPAGVTPALYKTNAANE